jgi:streptogramin lyase
MFGFRNILAITTLLVSGWLAPDSYGQVLVSGYGDGRIARFNEVTGAYLGDFVNAGSGGLTTAHSMTFGPDGNLYVTDVENRSVLRYNGLTGAFIDTFVTPGSGGGGRTATIAFGPDGNAYVSSEAGVLRYHGTTGAYINTFIPNGNGILSANGMLFRQGLLYVTCAENQSVFRFNAQTGQLVDHFVSSGSGGLNNPYHGITYGPDGNLYIASHSNNRVLRYNGSTGAFIDAFVPAGSGGLLEPFAIRFGPDGNLYVASELTNSILRYDGSTGAFLGTFIGGPGMVSRPVDIIFLSQVSEPTSLALAGIAVVGWFGIRLRRRGVREEMPMSRYLILVASLAVTVGAPPRASAQVIQTAMFNGTTYHLLAENRWDQSEAQSIALGGHLVTVNSAAENDFVFSTFASTANALAPTGTRSLWIGLNDIQVEGTFVWVSGQPVTYTNWILGEPNGGGPPEQDYAGIFIGGPNWPPAQFGGWHDIIAGLQLGDRTFGVVEVTPVPEPTSLALAGFALIGWLGNRFRRTGARPSAPRVRESGPMSGRC